MMMADKKPLVDFEDAELYTAYRQSLRNVEYIANNYYEEIVRRSEDRHTRAMRRWTAVMAGATLVNTLAILVQLLRTFGLL
jgi:hypothetical protein